MRIDLDGSCPDTFTAAVKTSTRLLLTAAEVGEQQIAARGALAASKLRFLPISKAGAEVPAHCPPAPRQAFAVHPAHLEW